ncbi:MAG: hypothetical protein AAFV53_18100 [Myxococcota bacterium]
MTEERLAELMVRVADQSASPAEQQELQDHLRHHPELQEELDAHMKINAITDDWMRRLDLDLAEDRFQVSATTRLELRLGTALVVVGLGTLSGFGLVEMLLDPAAPLWVKVGMSALAGGILVMLLSVIRWKLATRKSDAYQEIVR